ncbi:protein kinase C delta type-like [Anomaloglossus baeobatrachus]
MVERRVLQLASGSPFLLHGSFAFQTKELVLLGMEYVTCGELDHLLMRKGCLDIPSARFYAAELVCGIQHLHSKGVIHRDLKPSNILVAATGHIKIADFGLALLNIYGDRTATEYAGTPGFIAPEMLAAEEYNAGVDWYAFGIILNIMITSRSKYHRGLFNASSKEAKNLIKKLLREDPAKRLGVNGNIRAHRFFQCIDWDSVESLRMCPPHIPVPPRNIQRGSRPFNLQLLEAAEANNSALSADHQALFTGFSFTNISCLKKNIKKRKIRTDKQDLDKPEETRIQEQSQDQDPSRTPKISLFTRMTTRMDEEFQQKTPFVRNQGLLKDMDDGERNLRSCKVAADT